jgi:pimeloyl-ACP methyl ester carboxylesterase
MEKFFTIVYLDSRGCGRSAKPKTTKDHSWNDLTSDLEALRNLFNLDTVWLMGHSEGGIEVLHYACQHPDRVAGLVLFAASAKFGLLDDLVVFGRAMKRKDEPWFAEAMKVQQTGPPKSDAELNARIEKQLPGYWAKAERIEKYRNDFAATTMSLQAFNSLQDSNRRHFDLTQKLGKIKAPAFIIVGDRDDACPEYMSRILHLGLVKSKLLVLDDCGHFPWMEQAAEFEAQLPQYLKSLGISKEN